MQDKHFGSCLTRPEDALIWNEKTRLEEEKEATEALKQKTKSDTLHAWEVQRYKESDTKIFDLPLGHYTRKYDVQDIAAAFNLAWKEGTVAEIFVRIKEHMATNPGLKTNPCFAGLYLKH